MLVAVFGRCGRDSYLSPAVRTVPTATAAQAAAALMAVGSPHSSNEEEDRDSRSGRRTRLETAPRPESRPCPARPVKPPRRQQGTSRSTRLANDLGLRRIGLHEVSDVKAFVGVAYKRFDYHRFGHVSAEISLYLH